MAVAALAVGAPAALATGTGLTPAGCIDAPQTGASDPCAPSLTLPGNSFGATPELAFSPDGANLYAASGAGDLYVFDRAASGALTEAECIEDAKFESSGPGTGACGALASTQARGIGDSIDVAVSPDGANVYSIGGGGEDTLAEFARGAGGALTYVGCWESTASYDQDVADSVTPPCGSQYVNGLATPRWLTVSPDGKNIYVAAGSDVLSFTRGAGGALTPAGCIEDSLSGAGPNGQELCASATTGLQGARSVAVSPDGANVYVVGENSDAVVTFDRGAGGALTAVGCVQEPSQPASEGTCGATTNGLLDPRIVAISPSGGSVAVLTQIDLAVFSRGAGGALTDVGCAGYVPGGTGGSEEPTCSAVGENFADLNAVAFSPDGQDLYAGGGSDESIFLFPFGGGAPDYAGCIEGTSEGGLGGPFCGPQSQFSDIGPVTSLAVNPNGGGSLYAGTGATGTGEYGGIAEFARTAVAPPAPPAPPPPPTGTTPPKGGGQHLSQAQKRARAIAACRRLPRRKRARCIANAKKRYPLHPRKRHHKHHHHKHHGGRRGRR